MFILKNSFFQNHVKSSTRYPNRIGFGNPLIMIKIMFCEILVGIVNFQKKLELFQVNMSQKEHITPAGTFLTAKTSRKCAGN
jgi:hypothetical protein